MVTLQIAPVAASASGNGIWIEICSEAGVVLKQVDLRRPDAEQDSRCPTCADCPFCAVSHPNAVRIGGIDRAAKTCLSGAGVMASQGNIENPAQFWPENRGPPRHNRAVQITTCDSLQARAVQLSEAAAP